MLKIEPATNVIRIRSEPQIIPRAEHNISRAAISENALKVLYRLKNAGYKAYLVGGGVRDLLLNLKPKDFDVVTDARPEQIRELFRNCRLIGRRFRRPQCFQLGRVIQRSVEHDPIVAYLRAVGYPGVSVVVGVQGRRERGHLLAERTAGSHVAASDRRDHE